MVSLTVTLFLLDFLGHTNLILTFPFVMPLTWHGEDFEQSLVYTFLNVWLCSSHSRSLFTYTIFHHFDVISFAAFVSLCPGISLSTTLLQSICSRCPIPGGMATFLQVLCTFPTSSHQLAVLDAFSRAHGFFPPPNSDPVPVNAVPVMLVTLTVGTSLQHFLPLVRGHTMGIYADALLH